MSKATLALPAPVDRSYTPFRVDGSGNWVILGDVHLPYHDTRTVELAVAFAKKRRANLLLNGDILDSHHLSTFDKDPSAPRYIEERNAALQLFGYLRQELGKKARIVFKSGNHEERFDRYLMSKADALYGLPGLRLPAILELDKFGIEFVGDKRPIQLGKLNVLHGHEHKGGITAPVNPARGLFLRAKTVAACNHFHQTSEHHEPDLTGKPLACWSIGCACQLSPAYMPLNKWNLGFANVELSRGKFHFTNLRVMDGEIV